MSSNTKATTDPSQIYDVLLFSHRDDKEFTSALHDNTRKIDPNIRLFYDEETILWGGTERETAEAIWRCKKAVVIISNSIVKFTKQNREQAIIQALLDRQWDVQNKLILPLLLGVTTEKFRRHYPLLATIRAMETPLVSDPQYVAQRLLKLLGSMEVEMTEQGIRVVQPSMHFCSLPPEAPCHGRDKELASVVRKITDPKVHVCCVHGLPGVGKTVLGKAAAHNLINAGTQTEWKATYVSLGEHESQDQCLHAILDSLGKDPIDGQEFTHLQHLMKETDITEHVLVLDACDKALRYQNVQFHSLLFELAKCFKIITTSVTRYENDRLAVSYLHLKPFDPKTAQSVLSLLCDMGRKLKTNTADELVKLCNYMPIEIRIMTAVLRSQQYTPKGLLLHLEADDGDDASVVDKLDTLVTKKVSLVRQVRPCFETAYNCLPRSLQWQLALLSLFPGSFSDKACAFVLQMENKSSVMQEVLGPLQECSLLSPGKNRHQYVIHGSIVGFLRDKFKKFSVNCRMSAITRFCEYYMKGFKRALAHFLNSPKQSVLLFDRNRSNYELLLKYAVPTTLYQDYMDLVINSDDLLRVTLNVDQRCKLYEECTKAANQKNDLHRLCAATLCWTAAFLDASNIEDVKTCLESISAYKEALKDRLLIKYRILEAFVMISQGNPKQATTHLMENCLKKDSPANSYPLLKAKALIALGDASVALGDKCAAIEQYEMAKQHLIEGLTKESQLPVVPTSTSKGVPVHPDICFVQLRIAHWQFQMGNYTASKSTFLQVLAMQSRLSCDRLSRAMTTYNVGISLASIIHTAERLDPEKFQDAVEYLGAAQEEAMRLSKSHPLIILAPLALGSLFFRKGLTTYKTKQKDTRTEFEHSLTHFTTCAQHCEELEEWRESTTAVDAIAHQAIISAVLKTRVKEEVTELKDKCIYILHRQSSNEDRLPAAVRYVLSTTFPDCCKSLGALRVSFKHFSSNCFYSLCMTKRQSSLGEVRSRPKHRRVPRSHSLPITSTRCQLIDQTAPSTVRPRKRNPCGQTRVLMHREVQNQEQSSELDSPACPTVSEDNHQCSTSPVSDKSGTSCSPVKGQASSFRQSTCGQDVVKAESTSLSVSEGELKMVSIGDSKDARKHCCIQ